MRNPTSAVLGAVKRRKRGVASVVSVAAIGTLALGTLGTGVATAHGMVDSERIQNQTIQTQDIGQNGVGASEVGPNAIHKWNINQNSVGIYELNDYAVNQLSQEGEQGPRGPEGPQGPKGEPGDDGVSGAHTEKPNSAIEEVAPGETVTTTATCNEGESAIGGGYHVKDAKPATLAHARVTKSGPGPNDSYDGSMFGGYEVTVTNTGENGAFNVYPYVICASVN